MVNACGGVNSVRPADSETPCLRALPPPTRPVEKVTEHAVYALLDNREDDHDLRFLGTVHSAPGFDALVEATEAMVGDWPALVAIPRDRMVQIDRPENRGKVIAGAGAIPYLLVPGTTWAAERGRV